MTDQKAESAAAADKRAVEAPNSGWRKTAIVTLLVLASILAPLAVASIWVKNQVTDTDRYVRTMKPLASNPAIQSAVAANVTDALFTRVDVEARAKEALPPKLKQFSAPVAAGIENYAQTFTKRFLATNAFEKIWVEVNRRAHKQLNKILTGQGHYVQTAHGDVVIDLAPVLAKLKERLDARGITVFDRVPTSSVNSRFVLISSKQLDNAQKGVRLLKAVAIALPLLVLALYAIAIGISRRRRRTLLQASLALVAGMALLGIGLTIGRSIYLDYVAGPKLPHDAATAFYDTLVHYLRLGIRVIAGIALLVAAGAFVTGPSRAAVAIRGWFGSLVGWAQGETGAGSTGFARWVRSAKRPLRIGAIVLPIAIFFLWNTPTVSLVIALVALSLFLLLVIELFARAPSERADHVPTTTS
ncbi:MAG TPA: hypothetical protein VF063_09265 [Gaiellaceae bacterium]